MATELVFRLVSILQQCFSFGNKLAYFFILASTAPELVFHLASIFPAPELVLPILAIA